MMRRFSRLRPATLSLAAASLLGLALLSCQTAPVATRTASSDASDVVLFQDVMRRVERSYVEPVDRGKLMTDALKGALTGLDPHSDYMDESEYHDMLSDTHGEFGGLGMELTLDHGVPKIISPIDDTPAARAGIRAGDLIPKIADETTDKMTLKEVVDRLRGPAGTPVRLTILRAATPPFEVTLTRAVIQVASVKSHLEADKIGYARIATFGEKTQSELVAAVGRLKEQAGGALGGFVLDLRNDPGGLLDAAVDVSGDFLDGGTVVSISGRDGAGAETYAAPIRGDRLRGVPVVVLINGASASASEIVAGALQDAKRATVMGTRSFGKGSVQTVIPLGGRGALRLTTARYYTPAGRSIQDHGIAPDVVLAVPKDLQVANGLPLHEADLRGALKNTGALNGKAAPTPAAQVAAADAAPDVPIDPTAIGTAKDTQLAAAVKFLHEKVVKSAAPPPRG